MQVDATTVNGGTPLFAAASSGHSTIVRLLATKGADTNVVVRAGAQHQSGGNQNGGTTPIFTACAKGHTEAVRALLDFGADLTATWTAPNGRRWTPLQVSP